MHKYRLQSLWLLGSFGEAFQCVRIAQGERTGANASQPAEMSAATKRLAQFVRNRAHVTACTHCELKLRLCTLQRLNHKLRYLNAHWLQGHLFTSARQGIGWLPCHLLGRESRWQLVDASEKFPGGLSYIVQSQAGLTDRTNGLPFRIEGVCRKSEADGSYIAFLAGGKILGKPRESTQNKRENSAGHWIQRTEMTDRALAGDFSNPGDNIVTCHAARLIHHKKSVHSTTLDE